MWQVGGMAADEIKDSGYHGNTLSLQKHAAVRKSAKDAD